MSRPFENLRVNGILEIYVTEPSLSNDKISKRTDLESVIRDDSRRNVKNYDVLEAYFLTLMGFEIEKREPEEWLVFLILGYRHHLNIRGLYD